MTVTAGSQAFEFFICICCGGIIAIIYNTLWYIRDITNRNKIITFIADIIFGILSILCMFYALKFASLGAVRFYHFIGFIIGFIILNYFLSNFIRKYVKKAGNYIAHLYTYIRTLPFWKKILK